MTPRAAFITGLKDITPFVIGAIPFGMLAGFLAMKLGFEVWHAMALSVGVFAGASQLVGLELMSASAAIPVVFLSALAVNARFLLYSASLAPYTKDWPMGWKILNAFMITDQSYAMCLQKFEDHFENNRWYTFGCNILSWVSWITMTFLGAVFGSIIPDTLALEFAMPLMFLFMGALFIKDRITVTVAMMSGALSIILITLPYNAGLMTAILSGVVLGYGLDRITSRGVK
jgi:4-azaleucine resistance transporter AzlC